MRIRKSLLWTVVIIEFAIIVGGLIYISNNGFADKRKQSVLVIDVFGELTSTVHTYEEGYLEATTFTRMVSSTDIVEALKKYEKDDTVQAFILHIDSNGGDEYASDELTQQIRIMDKPVVAVISNNALSTGYYIAAPTDRIFASELSNVADIGFVRTAHYEDETGQSRLCYVSSSEFKRMYLDDCPGFDPAEYQWGVDSSELSTRQIAADIAIFRNLSYSHVMGMSDGTIFNGNGALKLGLIDQIGGLHDAVDWLEKEFGTKFDIVYYSELG